MTALKEDVPKYKNVKAYKSILLSLLFIVFLKIKKILI